MLLHGAGFKVPALSEGRYVPAAGPMEHHDGIALGEGISISLSGARSNSPVTHDRRAARCLTPEATTAVRL